MIIIGKAPYRISLLGGGTDLDWFIEESQYGLSLGYSLNMYSYSVINQLPNTSKRGILNYSSRELYTKNDEIVHPLIREAFLKTKLSKIIELSTYGNASGGSGLGGSSSFLISLIVALSKLLKLDWDNELIAQKASEIEIKELQKPIGRQDQYLSALGGISNLEFKKGGHVNIKEISNEKLSLFKKLINNFYLIPTNTFRNSDNILNSIKKDPNSRSNLIELRNIAKDFLETNESREYILEKKFHQCMRSSWEIKKNMSNVMNPLLEEQYNFINKIVPNNWIRLLGAGGGGFFLVSVKEDIQNLNAVPDIDKIQNIIKASMSPTGAESNVF